MRAQSIVQSSCILMAFTTEVLRISGCMFRGTTKCFHSFSDIINLFVICIHYYIRYTAHVLSLQLNIVQHTFLYYIIYDNDDITIYIY